jgi:hypothetical protein
MPIPPDSPEMKKDKGFSLARFERPQREKNEILGWNAKRFSSAIPAGSARKFP